MADSKFHKISPPKTVKELAEIVDADINGDADLIIHDVASLDSAGDKEISFLDNIKYKDDFRATKAAACIVAPKMAEFAPPDCVLIISDNPYKAYALIAQAFYPVSTPPSSVHKSAVISDSAEIGEGCCIEAGAVIGDNVHLANNVWVEANAVLKNGVQIGKNSRIGSNACVSHAEIGSSTRLYPGVCVGQDGFGFAIDPAGHVKVPQLGKVIIGDHVEIGANTCIDRGAGPDTIIGDGTWIDNCVQIGHNAQIGKGCVIVAQVGIAGSTTIEDYVVIAAKVGIAGHLTIGKGSKIAAMSGIMQDLAPGSEVMGYPALPLKQFLRQTVALKKLTKPKK